jgi:hypothetical protein
MGVVGTGVIAEVMHLHYLGEMADRFEIAAVCDIVPENARACAERYRVAAAFTDWREMLRRPLDAVLVLTSGSHAPIAIAAAEAGLHVLVRSLCAFLSRRDWPWWPRPNWPESRSWWRTRSATTRHSRASSLKRLR